MDCQIPVKKNTNILYFKNGVRKEKNYRLGKTNPPKHIQRFYTRGD